MDQRLSREDDHSGSFCSVAGINHRFWRNPVAAYSPFPSGRATRWDGQETLSPGKHTVVFEFSYEGEGMASLPSGIGGIGKGGTGVLKVDGKEVASKKMARTIPFILQWDETFDVGAHTGTPVDDKDYQVPFRFTGVLNKLTLQLKPVALSAADRKMLQDKARRNNAASQ
jgi:hypothetical protein